jgi:hypothetical protein
MSCSILKNIAMKKLAFKAGKTWALDLFRTYGTHLDFSLCWDDGTLLHTPSFNQCIYSPPALAAT